MKWGVWLLITLIVAFMVLYEWPKIAKTSNRERTALLTLGIIGWLLGALLVFFPEMAGPTQLVNVIFRPLGRLLDK